MYSLINIGKDYNIPCKTYVIESTDDLPTILEKDNPPIGSTAELLQNNIIKRYKLGVDRQWYPYTDYSGGGYVELPISPQNGGTGNNVGYIQTGLTKLDSRVSSGGKSTIEGTNNLIVGNSDNSVSHIEGFDNIIGDMLFADQQYTSGSTSIIVKSVEETLITFTLTVSSRLSSQNEFNNLNNSNLILKIDSYQKPTEYAVLNNVSAEVETTSYPSDYSKFIYNQNYIITANVVYSTREFSVDDSFSARVFKYNSQPYGHCEGNMCICGSTNHAEGSLTTAMGSYSHAEGNSTKAIGYCSHAEGSMTIACDSYSHAEGQNTKAYGMQSHAEGGMSEAWGYYSHAEGYNTKAKGNNSHTEGAETLTSGQSSHAEGNYCKAVGAGDHVEGYSCETKTAGMANHVEGYQSIAENAYYCHVEGGGCKANQGAYYSHVEGNYCENNSQCSHVEGYYCKSNQGAMYSHVEGYYCESIGSYSHAEGYYCKANEYSHVQGKYNIIDEDKKYAHIIGNGTQEDARSNAHTVDWNGNAWYKGNLYLGGTSQDDAEAYIANVPKYNAETPDSVLMVKNGVLTWVTKSDFINEILKAMPVAEEVVISDLPAAEEVSV